MRESSLRDYARELQEFNSRPLDKPGQSQIEPRTRFWWCFMYLGKAVECIKSLECQIRRIRALSSAGIRGVSVGAAG